MTNFTGIPIVFKIPARIVSPFSTACLHLLHVRGNRQKKHLPSILFYVKLQGRIQHLTGIEYGVQIREPVWLVVPHHLQGLRHHAEHPGAEPLHDRTVDAGDLGLGYAGVAAHVSSLPVGVPWRHRARRIRDSA